MLSNSPKKGQYQLLLKKKMIRPLLGFMIPTGIDPEIMSRLFSKFATKSDTGGTGLGLFISKSIIEAHGGTISFDNNWQVMRRKCLLETNLFVPLASIPL
jgi:hypothetical protein